MAERQVKVVGKHARGCWREWGPIPWRDGDPVTVTTERRYGKRGRAFRKWVRFHCNNTQCKAELHVEERFILAAALRSTSTTNTPEGPKRGIDENRVFHFETRKKS